MITKIISGGQTGVDRGALDFAIRSGIEHGGFCPKGRISENGRIPDKYKLTECSSPAYIQRTARNVQESDGTLILTRGKPEGGTKKTIQLCVAKNKPKLVINMHHRLHTYAFVEWVRTNNIRVLNVAGPRESKQSGIHKQSKQVLEQLFEALRSAT